MNPITVGGISASVRRQEPERIDGKEPPTKLAASYVAKMKVIIDRFLSLSRNKIAKHEAIANVNFKFINLLGYIIVTPW